MLSISKEMGFKLYQQRLQSANTAVFYYLFDKLTSLFIKSKPVKITSPKKILIVRNDHIGDVVLCSQVYREIKRVYPRSKITALVSPVSAVLLEKNPHIDNLLTIDLFWRNKNLKSLRRYFGILKKIKSEKFDVGIDIRGSLLNIIFFLWMPNIKKRVSYFNTTGGKPFLTNPIEFKKIEHTIKFDADLVAKGLSFKIKDYWPEIVVDKSDEKEVNKFLFKNKLKNYICICPGATSVKKQWPVRNFDKLMKKVKLKYKNYGVVVIGGEEDRDLVKHLCRGGRGIPLINFNLRLLSILFRKSKLVIANDGGPMHIAWVSGAKVLALWGPINLETIRPLKRSLVIHHQDESATSNNLMDLITLDEVEQKLNFLLKNDFTVPLN